MRLSRQKEMSRRNVWGSVKGDAGAERHVSFFIAKVTCAADVFWKFVEGQREEYQFFGVGEHHLDSTRTVDALRKATQIGLQSFWTPANPTGRGGTSGGTAVLCDARV